MLPYFTTTFGNAASRAHSFGWAAADAVDNARQQIAALIGADSREIVFTSGATESNNLALKGVVAANSSRGNHLVISATEHQSVTDTARALETAGVSVTTVGVDSQGRLDLDQLVASITDATVLVSVMVANNEVGTVNDLAAIGTICRDRHVLLHTDATQAAGKIPLSVADVDLMSLSAHKIYGPKGVGALYVKREPRVSLTAQMDGGGHERGMRSGTLNVPAIVGFGVAAQIAADELKADAIRVNLLRDQLIEGIRAIAPDSFVNGHAHHRLPGIASVTFPGQDAGRMVGALNDHGIAVSTGSACSSSTLEPSRTLLALGLSEADAKSTLRFSLGRFNTAAEVELVLNVIGELTASRQCAAGRADGEALW
jgi:cysteine desulfurase